MFALHNVDPRRLDRTSLPDNYRFLPKQQEEIMDRSATGLRRRSVSSNKKLPRTPLPTQTTFTEEIDPLDPAPPLTPLRRRSTSFRHFEPKQNSSILRWFWSELIFLFNIVSWIFKTIGIVISLIFAVALFNALPLEVRTKTARNFFEIATGWNSLLDHDGWLIKAATEWVMGMMVFERNLLECLKGNRELCRFV